MNITNVEIANFRALEKVAVPLQQFSVLLGENDVGKTSFLYAIEKFFLNKKLNDPKDWYKKNTENPIRITITFTQLPNDNALDGFKRDDGSIVVSKIYGFDATPETNAILDDQSAVNITRPVINQFFSQDSFHFIPVRRDLTVQFSMNKTALLGKLLRTKMKNAIQEDGAEQSLEVVQNILAGAINEPREVMETFLREQLNNDTISLGFEDLQIDPTEGVTFSVTLSDDRVNGVEIQDRGAGTQNNLIIALFRLIASSDLQGQFIFAMEEPENSLHPKAQRQLLSVVQEISENNQVIVTTHSPVFIDRSKFESNILLTRKAAGNTVAKVFDPVDLPTIRTDLGIRASDALLKGGGNCAVLVEGSTEEDGFPVFMEMIGLSEFELGIAIINMGGSDLQKAKAIIQLLRGYDIPCIVVLDQDALQTEEDLRRMQGDSLTNLNEIYRLSKGTIEDYYPPAIMAAVINQEFSPNNAITEEELTMEESGAEKLHAIKRIMFEHGAGDSIEYFKRALGGVGTRMMRSEELPVDGEIEQILRKVSEIARTI